jgi:hypothetical protein
MTACDVETKDLLQTNKFQVVIERFPAIEYYTQQVPIPGFSIGTPVQYTNNRYDLKRAGDKIEFEDVIVSFLVDENLQSIRSLLEWTNLAVSSIDDEVTVYSDMSILLYTGNKAYNKRITFHNSFPYATSGTGLDITTPSDNPLSIDASFKYTHYTIS